MYRILIVAAAASIIAGCGGKSPDGAAEPATSASSSGGSSAPVAAAGAPKSSGASASTASPGSSGDFVNRTIEVANPDDSTMVFLFHDLAGIPAPIDKWVEDDSRVRYGPAPDKAANREVVRASLAAGAAAVKDVGFIRLTMNANLSEYDPSYGEFTVRALAPSSMVTFSALGEQISIKFGNGLKAQVWSVPQADSQAIRDKIPYVGNVDMDVLLKPIRVQPDPKGGTITADVVEYELRERQSGAVLGRIKVGG